MLKDKPTCPTDPGGTGTFRQIQKSFTGEELTVPPYGQRGQNPNELRHSDRTGRPGEPAQPLRRYTRRPTSELKPASGTLEKSSYRSHLRHGQKTFTQAPLAKLHHPGMCPGRLTSHVAPPVVRQIGPHKDQVAWPEPGHMVPHISGSNALKNQRDFKLQMDKQGGGEMWQIEFPDHKRRPHRRRNQFVLNGRF